MIGRNIIRFIALLLVQILILNNLDIFGHANAYLYILFILLLPFDIPGFLLLILSFLMGLSVDFFSNTLGMHAAAATLLAFLRPSFLRLAYQKEDIPLKSEPGLKEMGFKSFYMYALSLTLIHHLFLFVVDTLKFSNFLQIILDTLTSSVITIVLIMICMYLFRKKTEISR